MDKMHTSGYDLLAPFYDDGVALLFGKGIYDAQIFFLDQITPYSNILILGGGSGWIITELLKRCPTAHITYIDASPKMIELAKKKAQRNVEFICGTESNIPANSFFDFIITNFYVDGFSYVVLHENISLISKFLKPTGKWIVTDFIETGKKKHAFILWLTHLFFRILINHPNKKLIDWQKAFKEKGFTHTHEMDFNNGFIRTCIYS